MEVPKNGTVANLKEEISLLTQIKEEVVREARKRKVAVVMSLYTDGGSKCQKQSARGILQR